MNTKKIFCYVVLLTLILFGTLLTCSVTNTLPELNLHSQNDKFNTEKMPTLEIHIHSPLWVRSKKLGTSESYTSIPTTTTHYVLNWNSRLKIYTYHKKDITNIFFGGFFEENNKDHGGQGFFGMTTRGEKWKFEKAKFLDNQLQIYEDDNVAFYKLVSKKDHEISVTDENVIINFTTGKIIKSQFIDHPTGKKVKLHYDRKKNAIIFTVSK